MGSKFAVWEWENEIKVFMPYSSEVSSALENALAANTQDLMLGTVDPYLETFKVDLKKMVQVTTYSGKERTVRRVGMESNHPFYKGIKWEWNFHGDHWYPYNAGVCKAISEGVAGGQHQITSPTHLPGYTIDMSSMVQVNQNTSWKRKIRQITCTAYLCPVGGNQRPTRTVVTPARSAVTPARPVATPARPAVTPARPAVTPARTVVTPARPAVTPTRSVNVPVATVRPTPSRSTAASSSAASNAAAGASSSAASNAAGASSSAASNAAAGASSTGTPLSTTLQALLQSSCTPYTTVAHNTCPVCQNNLSDTSDYTTPAALAGLHFDRLTLTCRHHLHTQCLHAMITAANNPSSFTCPECQKIYGVQRGDQPKGKMSVKVDPSISLGGYESVGALVVTYNFTSGVHNGVSYSANNFPRTAYFPDNPQGNVIVDLLKKAFKRRLVFTIGTSNTTGQRDCLVWNDIHHKTSRRRGDTYGYPDLGYLTRVLGELKNKGIE